MSAKLIDISDWQNPYASGYGDGYSLLGDREVFLKKSLRYNLYQEGLLDGLADAISDKAKSVQK